MRFTVSLKPQLLASERKKLMAMEICFFPLYIQDYLWNGRELQNIIKESEDQLLKPSYKDESFYSPQKVVEGEELQDHVAKVTREKTCVT